MMKRTISILLVLVSVLCLSAPAFAAEAGEEAGEAAILWDAADEGPALDGAAPSGWVSESGAWYYYSSNARQTGWLKLGGVWYYLDPDNDGAMATGWKDVDGAKYYFSSKGAMATGWKSLDGRWYYFGSSGARQTGWQKIGGAWYYLDPDNNGAMVTGSTEMGDGAYYFKSSGAMATGWQKSGGIWYYYTSSGAMKTGWMKSGGVWYYLDPDNGGAMVTGRREIGGSSYYFKSSGAMATGWQKIGGAWYYYASSGELQTGLKTIGGARYYLDPENDGAMATGWLELDEVSYYFKSSGAMATGWLKMDGKWYYFDSSGVKQTGWLKRSGLWYYLDPEEGGAMATGWRDDIDEDVTYYFWSSGRMSNKPTYIDGSMYYFASSGALQTSTTLTRCGKKYTVDENGVIVGYVTDAMRKAVKVLNKVGWSLYSAFRWSASLTYYGRWLRAPSGATHTEWYANYGFTNNCGNCFIINSTFYQMAKALGYDVYFVEGGVLNSSGGLAPHGWVEIYYDGSLYVCDPEFQGATGLNGYLIWYGKHNTWRYSSYSRVS